MPVKREKFFATIAIRGFEKARFAMRLIQSQLLVSRSLILSKCFKLAVSTPLS
jgi:hypothetical protein